MLFSASMYNLSLHRRAARRMAVRAAASSASDPRDHLAVFQAHDKISRITLWDVEDVLAVSSHFKNKKDAEDYCYAQGVHMENALTYYSVVANLKACYRIPSFSPTHNK